MNCEEFRKAIDGYLDGELTEKESSEFEQHLEYCQRCRMELMSFEKCIGLMRNFFHDENPPAAIRKKVFEKCCDPKRMDCFPSTNKE
jgi:anti-sigma factor RsiW